MVSNFRHKMLNGFLGLVPLVLLFLSAFFIYSRIVASSTAVFAGNSQTTFSLRCIGTNNLRIPSHFDIAARIDLANGAGSIAAYQSDAGDTTFTKPVSEIKQTINGNEYIGSVFYGPKIKHVATCLKRDFDFGALSASQINISGDNPPLLMGKGGNINADELKIIPTNRQRMVDITKGRPKGQGGVSVIEYGQGTENLYSIAIVYPSFQPDNSLANQYSVQISSALNGF